MANTKKALTLKDFKGMIEESLETAGVPPNHGIFINNKGESILVGFPDLSDKEGIREKLRAFISEHHIVRYMMVTDCMMANMEKVQKKVKSSGKSIPFRPSTLEKEYIQDILIIAEYTSDLNVEMYIIPYDYDEYNDEQKHKHRVIHKPEQKKIIHLKKSKNSKGSVDPNDQIVSMWNFFLEEEGSGERMDQNYEKGFDTFISDLSSDVVKKACKQFSVKNEKQLLKKVKNGDINGKEVLTFLENTCKEKIKAVDSLFKTEKKGGER